MPDNTEIQDQPESQEKLRQIRYNLTRSKTILDELEEYYKQFDEIRKQLDDDKDGLKVNLEWSQAKKQEIDQLATDATAKLTELETLKDSTATLVEAIKASHQEFEELSEKITDPATGIEAVFTSANNYLIKIKSALDSAQADYASAQSTLADIESKSTEIETAYEDFVELKEKVDDPEEGIAAQYEAIKKFAKDAAQAKNSAESELASVISLKSTATDDLATIQESKEQIDSLQKEGATLVEDIKNNLDISTADSLSAAITEQRKRFDRSVLVWGIGTGLVITLLAIMLGYIYYTLFVAEGKTNVLTRDINAWTILVTAISKAIFTSPIIFALYFTATNFSRVKEVRDNYIGKEIAAKNLQAYVKLLRSQFSDAKEQRLEFTLRNMQAIYDDPTLNKKKRRYNIGINKFFQFDIQEEDMQQIKDSLKETTEAIIENKAKDKK